MPLWRRKPLHEQLARAGGLLPGDGGPLDPRPPLETGIHGLARPREWDLVVAVEAALEGEGAQFVALPDGTLIVEEGPDGVEPLAEAVEAQLPRPYRAEAVRREEGLWAVAANRIEVVRLDGAEGDVIELAVQADHRTLLVDGERAFGSMPALEALATMRAGDAYVVRAVRLDGDLWEVKVGAL